VGARAVDRKLSDSFGLLGGKRDDEYEGKRLFEKAG
jgi:hypothetical protein